MQWKFSAAQDYHMAYSFVVKRKHLLVTLAHALSLISGIYDNSKQTCTVEKNCQSFKGYTLTFILYTTELTYPKRSICWVTTFLVCRSIVEHTPREWWVHWGWCPSGHKALCDRKMLAGWRASLCSSYNAAPMILATGLWLVGWLSIVGHNTCKRTDPTDSWSDRMMITQWACVLLLTESTPNLICLRHYRREHPVTF